MHSQFAHARSRDAFTLCTAFTLGGNPSWLVTSTMIDPYPLSRYAQDMAGLEAGSSAQPLQSTASLTGFRCRTCAQLMEANWENGVRIARMRGTQIRHVSTAPTPGLVP